MKLSASFIKQSARQVGFHACGIAQAESLPDFQATLDSWRSLGYNADMQYMERNADKRSDPRLLYAGAKSVISVLVSYKPSRTIEGPYKIARYAYGEDYHLRLKRMLFELIETIRAQYPDFKTRPFVDTAPISDKRWAAAAGLGWIGKNTLLVSPQFGSFCNIGELVTECEVDCYDQPLQQQCASCDLCMRSCPNGALQCVEGRYMLNASRCTAYNTIENRNSSLPDDLNTAGYIFGCDICQELCPHNRNTEPAVQIGDEHLALLQSLVTADEPQFVEATKGTPISRVNYSQWVRNLRQVALSTPRRS